MSEKTPIAPRIDVSSQPANASMTPSVQEASSPSAKASDAPKITVIVPLYNCEKYVAECLQSLQQQTLPDFEAICVNDCSPDNSYLVAQGAVAGDARFTFLSLDENRGPGGARNVALDKARGKYIVFLDSDDFFVPEALQKIYERAEMQQLDDMYFNAKSFYESAAVHKRVKEDFSHRPAFDGVATGRELFTFFQERGEFWPQGAMRMVRRGLLRKNGIRFREGIIHEDILFTFQTLVESQRSSFLNEPIYMRRVREGSVMGQRARSIRNVQGHYVCLTEMKRWMTQHAAELDQPFVAAMTRQMYDWRMVVGHDWSDAVSSQDRAEWLSSLSPEAQLDFYLDVIQPSAGLGEYLNSKTYRLGDAILSIPRAVREKLHEGR